MEFLENPLNILVGIAIAAAVIWGICWYLERLRTQAFESAADEMGLTFAAHVDLTAELAGFELFNKGHTRRFRNCITGETDETLIRIFDYRYTVGHGKHAHRHQQSVIAFCSRELDLPHFSIRPKSFMDRVGQALALTHDIQIDSAEFAKTFKLQGESELCVREFFQDEELLDLLTSQAKTSLEGHAQQLVFYREHQQIQPAKLRSFLAEGYRLLAKMSERSQCEVAAEA